MSVEFVAMTADGKEVDWIDPYLGHEEVSPGVYRVDNGYDTYEVRVPEGGRYVIRTLGSK